MSTEYFSASRISQGGSTLEFMLKKQLFGKIFAKNCMKIKVFGPGGGGALLKAVRNFWSHLFGISYSYLFQVATAVIMSGLFAYCNMTIACMLRNDDGRRGLLWCGVFTQIGSFAGAIIIFIFVNVLHSFQSMPSCC